MQIMKGVDVRISEEVRPILLYNFLVFYTKNSFLCPDSALKDPIQISPASPLHIRIYGLAIMVVRKECCGHNKLRDGASFELWTGRLLVLGLGPALSRLNRLQP